MGPSLAFTDRIAFPASSLFLLILSVSAMLTALGIDLAMPGLYLLEKGAPAFDEIHLARMALVIASSLLLVGSVAVASNNIASPAGEQIWYQWGHLSWSVGDRPSQTIFCCHVKKLLLWLILLASFSSLFLFLLHPYYFSKLGHEGMPVELLSATLLFFSCALFAITATIFRRKPDHFHLSYFVTALAFAGIFFLIGMEEVSWFQRVLGLETPAIFQGNVQEEMNLHNFITDEIENIYYFGSFFFLVLLPFFHDRLPLFKKDGLFSFFIPGRYVLFVSAIFTAYNYNMWNTLFTQLAFFCTIFILAYYVLRQGRLSGRGVEPLIILLAVISTQLLFLLFGNNFVRLWDITEYKEFFIPLAFLIYSLEVLHKAKMASNSAGSLRPPR
jgi:hypothetical protein